MTTWQSELQLGSGEIFEPEAIEDGLGHDAFQNMLEDAWRMTQGECANCGHSKEAHWDRYGCQVEGPDDWVDGEAMGAWVARGPCGCKDWKALEQEPQDEQDRRVSGPTYAEGQERLARVLDRITEAVEKRNHD